MKTRMAFVLPFFLIALSFVGCAGPAVRHDARVDRRGDVAERSSNRASTRQGNRYDRRDSRYERIDSRDGY